MNQCGLSTTTIHHVRHFSNDHSLLDGKVFEPRIPTCRPRFSDLLISPSECDKVGFYKAFSRPVAKVFFGAIFTYQAFYWLWVKLETDEIKNRKKSALSLLFMPDTIY